MKRERAKENSSIPPTMEHDGHMLDIDKLIDALLEAAPRMSKAQKPGITKGQGWQFFYLSAYPVPECDRRVHRPDADARGARAHPF